MASELPDFDPTALAAYGRLEVVAKLLVEGYVTGRHRSPFKGTSVEFVEHRHYTTGDEIRHIDWRAYAKTGEYYVKQFEEETNLRAYLLVDVSGSMAYQGKCVSKLTYAKTLAVAICYLLQQQRDACGLMTFSDRVLDRRDPATHDATFLELARLLEQRQAGRDGQLARILGGVLPQIKRRSLIFLFSDGFDDVAALGHQFRQYRSARHDLVFFQIAAPEEIEFPFRRPTRFRNLEDQSQERPVEPLRLRASYLERYQAFCKGLQQECATAGVDLVPVRTSDPYHKVLGGYLDQRQR